MSVKWIPKCVLILILFQLQHTTCEIIAAGNAVRLIQSTALDAKQFDVDVTPATDKNILHAIRNNFQTFVSNLRTRAKDTFDRFNVPAAVTATPDIPATLLIDKLKPVKTIREIIKIRKNNTTTTTTTTTEEPPEKYGALSDKFQDDPDQSVEEGSGMDISGEFPIY